MNYLTAQTNQNDLKEDKFGELDHFMRDMRQAAGPAEAHPPAFGWGRATHQQSGALPGRCDGGEGGRMQICLLICACVRVCMYGWVGGWVCSRVCEYVCMCHVCVCAYVSAYVCVCVHAMPGGGSELRQELSFGVPPTKSRRIGMHT